MAQDHMRNSAFAMSVPAAPMASQSLQSLPRPAAMGDSISSQLLLPDKMISGIIGKGGSIIREIAARSGAQVRVSQKDTINAAGERIVMMEGLPGAVAAAQQLISERCREIENEVAMRSAGSGGSVSVPGAQYSPVPQQFQQQQASPYGCSYAQQHYAQQPGSYAPPAQQYSALPTSSVNCSCAVAPIGAGGSAPPGYQISNPFGGGY